MELWLIFLHVTWNCGYIGEFFNFQEMQAEIFHLKHHDFCNLYSNGSAEETEREIQTKY